MSRSNRGAAIVLDDSFVQDPHPLLRELREHRPLARVQIPYGARGVLVTRDADARAVLTAPEISKDVRPALAFAAGAAENRPSVSAHLLNSDGRDHRRLRRCMADALKIDDLDHWLAIIEKVVADETDKFVSGRRSGDLRRWADRIPAAVITTVLGLTMPDSAALIECCRPLAEQHSRGAVARATTEVARRIAAVIESSGPPSAGLSRLIAARDAGAMDHRELVSSVFLAMFAGYETAAAFLGSAAGQLLTGRGRGWFRAFGSNPLPSVTELLRLEPPLAMATARLTRSALTLPSGSVPAGSLIFVSLAAANRDPRRYPFPDEPRLGRPAHLSFGFGDHYCLGQRVAQFEVSAALTALFDRAPSIRLSQPKELTYARSVFIRTPMALPVRWD